MMDGQAEGTPPLGGEFEEVAQTIREHLAAQGFMKLSGRSW